MFDIFYWFNASEELIPNQDYSFIPSDQNVFLEYCAAPVY